MINSIWSTTKSGDRLDVDLFDPYSSGLVVKEINGLGPVKADLGMERYALIDGAFLKGVRVGTRTVDLTLIPYGDDIQFFRRKAYEYFEVGEQIEFGVVTDHVSVKGDFYVESFEPNIFSQQEELKIGLVSLDPYWRTSSPQISGLVGFNDVTPLFQFPFSSSENKEIVFGDLSNTTGKDVRYQGDKSTGVIITFEFQNTVANLVVANTTHNETMTISKGGNFYKGEKLIIDTRQHKKNITHRVNGVDSWIPGILSATSQWLQLYPGVNTLALSFAGASDSVDVTIEFETLYRGV